MMANAYTAWRNDGLTADEIETLATETEKPRPRVCTLTPDEFLRAVTPIPGLDPLTNWAAMLWTIAEL